MMLRVFDFRAVASTRQTYVVVLVPGSKKRSKKRVGVKRGLVEKKERSPFLSPIDPCQLVPDPAHRPPAFSIITPDREPGTG